MLVPHNVTLVAWNHPLHFLQRIEERHMQTVLIVRLNVYTYGHEHLKIRDTRWNNIDVFIVYVSKFKKKKWGGGQSIPQAPVIRSVSVIRMYIIIIRHATSAYLISYINRQRKRHTEYIIIDTLIKYKPIWCSCLFPNG